MIGVPKPSPRTKKQKKYISSISPNLENEITEIWKDCVYLRAGFKSQLSGISATVENGKLRGPVNHHILKKNSHWLKFSLTNGICITHEEHAKIHRTTNPKQFLIEAEKMCSAADWMELMDLKRSNTKRPLVTIREDLLFTRQILIEKAMKGDTYLLGIYLKQRGIVL